jgi:predicted DNA binding CopG/RHH family protein
MKRLHVLLPDEIHARVKARASLRGMTIQQWVTQHVVAALEQDEAEDRKGGRG